MTTRVAIDLNVRVRGNQAYAGFEDVDGPLTRGDAVQVYEPETGLSGPARVTEIDDARQLVYLEVEWAKLHEPTSQPSSSRHPARTAGTTPAATPPGGPSAQCPSCAGSALAIRGCLGAAALNETEDS